MESKPEFFWNIPEFQIMVLDYFRFLSHKSEKYRFPLHPEISRNAT